MENYHAFIKNLLAEVFFFGDTDKQNENGLKFQPINARHIVPAFSIKLFPGNGLKYKDQEPHSWNHSLGCLSFPAGLVKSN